MLSGSRVPEQLDRRCGCMSGLIDAAHATKKMRVSAEQLTSLDAEGRMTPVRCDLHQWNDHEASFDEGWVRQNERSWAGRIGGMIENGTSVIENVDVERAGPPAHHLSTPSFTLKPLEKS